MTTDISFSSGVMAKAYQKRGNFLHRFENVHPYMVIYAVMTNGATQSQPLKRRDFVDHPRHRRKRIL
jgi:hypothetical protein